MAEPISGREILQARREAQMVLLEAIKEQRYHAAGQAHLAEAFALLEGTLTAQPTKEASGS